MSTPFMQTGLGFILRKDLISEESTFSLLSPFSTDMWIGVLVAFLLTGLCIFLVGRYVLTSKDDVAMAKSICFPLWELKCFRRISPTEWAEPETEKHHFTLLHSFWFITGALTLQGNPAVLETHAHSSCVYCSYLTFIVLPGAGPHPKALPGRVVTAIWWLFALMLLACYFGNFHTVSHSNNKHVSIRTFEDLANQYVIDYGTVESGSTMLYFKVCYPLSNTEASLDKWLNVQYLLLQTLYSAHARIEMSDFFFSLLEFQQPCAPTHLPSHGA